MEILVAYKVLSNNEIKDTRISVPMAETVANNLISTGQSGIAVNQVERMLTALENLKGRTYIPGTATFSKPEAKPAGAPKPEPKRRFRIISLNNKHVINFIRYLQDHSIEYEIIDTGSDVAHFELCCSDEEYIAVNKYLDLIYFAAGTL